MRPGVSLLALAAGAGTLAVAGLYAISIEHGGSYTLADPTPALIVTLLIAFALAATTGGLVRDLRLRTGLLGVAAAGVLGLAAVAVFSIGALLALPGFAALVGAVRASEDAGGTLAAKTAPLILVGAFGAFWTLLLLPL